MFWEMMQRHVK